jgi:hypothetical protein
MWKLQHAPGIPNLADQGNTNVPIHNQPNAQIIQVYCYKTLHVSGIFSAYHQEFCTGKFHAGLMTASKQSPDGPDSS